MCVCSGGCPAAGRQGCGDRGGAGEGEEEEQDGDGDPQVGTVNQIFLSSAQNIFCSRSRFKVMQATGVMERSPSVSESEFPVEVSAAERVIGRDASLYLLFTNYFNSRKEPKRFRSFSSCEYRKGVKVWDL